MKRIGVETNQALKQVGQILKWLDVTEKNIDLAMEEPSSWAIKKWVAEKKAITEIKKVMVRIGKYDYFEDDELNDFEKYMQYIVM
ncbi:hypothetical protein ACYSNW_11950 [Enterococcus sp. LJL99]